PPLTPQRPAAYRPEHGPQCMNAPWHPPKAESLIPEEDTAADAEHAATTTVADRCLVAGPDGRRRDTRPPLPNDDRTGAMVASDAYGHGDRHGRHVRVAGDERSDPGVGRFGNFCSPDCGPSAHHNRAVPARGGPQPAVAGHEY